MLPQTIQNNPFDSLSAFLIQQTFSLHYITHHNLQFNAPVHKFSKNQNIMCQKGAMKQVQWQGSTSASLA